MEGSARVFAGEFCQSTLFVPSVDAGSPGWVVTPGGAWCRQMLIAGVLTECAETGDLLRCRIADPTGAFDVVSGGRNTLLVQAFKKIAVPSFVVISGYAQVYQKNGNISLSVRPEQVQVIDRACRDQYLVSTAEHTLRRLDEFRSVIHETGSDERLIHAARHYTITPQKLLDLAGMVEGALLSVRPQEPQPIHGCQNVRSEVIELMENAEGPRGIAVEDIIDKMALRGILKEDVLAALESLIHDDECYQPQKGYVKLL